MSVILHLCVVLITQYNVTGSGASMSEAYWDQWSLWHCTTM